VALQTALKKNPRVRRAHYYLGTLGGFAEGDVRLDEAIAEFRRELKLAPADPLANMQLGMALVEAQRPAEALPALQVAIRSQSESPVAHFFLGRCQLALGKPADAVASLRKALELVLKPPVDEARAGLVHYQLGRALREVGNEQEASQHFAEAQRFSGERTEQSRQELARYLQDAPDPELPAALDLVRSPLAEIPAPARAELERRARASLTRAYFNLGVIHTQANRFERAADFFDSAARLTPDFPQVQYSLGVALFNAKRYDKAAEPLTRALAATPDDANVRRMLALSCLNTEQYDKAADLLRDDPQRAADASLQYAYGLALVRSDRAAEAEAIFSGLLSAHGQNPELNVVLAQAHAQQGDFEAAIESVKRALQAKPDVADAHATLGIIYLRQGRLKEAADALEAGLKLHPRDIRAKHTLAMVHDMDGRYDEAVSLLRSVLRERPDHADARYLLGKILLAQGKATDAVDQLETAVRLAPEDANIHYQLAQAYQKLGRAEQAERQFARYRELKDRRR
jgi:tetratricopeptide (TPR) repeat protein